jgi:hypothetical protein
MITMPIVSDKLKSEYVKNIENIVKEIPDSYVLERFKHIKKENMGRIYAAKVMLFTIQFLTKNEAVGENIVADTIKDLYDEIQNKILQLEVRIGPEHKPRSKPPTIRPHYVAPLTDYGGNTDNRPLNEILDEEFGDNEEREEEFAYEESESIKEFEDEDGLSSIEP